VFQARNAACYRGDAVRALLVLGLGVSVVEAAPHHCLDERGDKLIVDETLIGVANPDGAENQVKVSVCWPLIERPGLMFDYTSVEAGLYNYLSPIYVQQGAFVSVTPLSPLVLRAEAAGVQYWPLPIDGAGYYALDSYRASYQDSALPAARASAATGVEAGVSATLQGELELAPRLAIAVTDTLNPEYWSVGTGAFWFDQRRDAILARHDWLVKNTALLFLELKRTPAKIRIGAFDDVTSVPRAGYVAHIVGAVTMVELRHLTPSMHELSAFVRLGDYTEHAFRRGPTALFGVSAVWERLHR
jgi:hypothetical protein